MYYKLFWVHTTLFGGEVVFMVALVTGPFNALLLADFFLQYFFIRELAFWRAFKFYLILVLNNILVYLRSFKARILPKYSTSVSLFSKLHQARMLHPVQHNHKNITMHPLISDLPGTTQKQLNFLKLQYAF